MFYYKYAFFPLSFNNFIHLALAAMETVSFFQSFPEVDCASFLNRQSKMRVLTISVLPKDNKCRIANNKTYV